MRKRAQFIFVICLLIFQLLFITGCGKENEIHDENHTEAIDTETVSDEFEESIERDEAYENSTFQICFFDVGQADAALIECDGHYMLIDGGNRDDADFMYTMLRNRNIRHLDIVVGSHPDEDHIGGLAGALNYATADIILCSATENDTECFKDFDKYANISGNGIDVPKIGDQYTLGSADISILGVNAGENSNDSSIILKITYGETSFLFTGDAEYAAEQSLKEQGVDYSATLLKVAHHGNEYGSSEEFLKKVNPEYAVISVGRDNAYYHPSKTLLERLTNENITFYRTDLQGEIVVTSDGKELSITTEKQALPDEMMLDGKELAALPTFIDNLIIEEETEGAAEDVTRGERVSADYIINKNSEKFHYPECESVEKMNEDNKVYFQGTREELINNGLKPCGNCKP